MADVKWSTLFPKSGGSGRGGAFTGKVFTPAMSPYLVSPGDRLVVMKTDQPLVIDPSGIKADGAFQVVDASRNFDKSPVTIKGDKVAIQIVGAGNDLVLDMIGAGNLWEFIVGDDGNNGKQLLVADSPGYTGYLPGGGGGSAPASGGSVGGAMILTGNGTPQKALTYPIPGLGGPQAVLYIDNSPIKPEDIPTNILRTYLWPANTPDDGTHNKWQATELGTLQQIIWKTDEIDKDHKLFFTGEGDPSALRLSDLIETPKPAQGKKGFVNAVYLDTEGKSFWANVIAADDTSDAQWINIGGGGGATPFDRDDFLRKWIDPLMLMRAPLFVGQADPTLDTSLDVGGRLDSLYLNTTSGQWFMWPKNNMLIDTNTGKARADAKNLWTPIGGGGAIATVGVGPNTPVTNAVPGTMYKFDFPDGAQDIPDVKVTLPTPKPGDQPIRILFSGGMSDAPAIQGQEYNDVFGSYTELDVTSPVPIIGSWDDFNSGDTTLNLDTPGEYIEFSPLVDGDKVNWFISNANYVTEDTHVIVIGKSEYWAKMGQTIVSNGCVLITLPEIKSESGLAPITIVFRYNEGFGARPDPGGAIQLSIVSWQADNGATNYFVGKVVTDVATNKIENMPYDSKRQAVVIFDGDWVQFTPVDADTTGQFWLITGGTPALDVALRG